MAHPALPADFDISDPHRVETGVPLAELAELRRSAPIWWNAQAPGVGGFDDGGFWLVSRHADVREASIKSDVFSTWANTAIVRYGEGMTREDIEMTRLIMLNVDPPDHTKLRRIVSRGFTPRAIGMLKEALTDRARRIVAEALAAGEGDFVTQVACELPLQAIAELIGVPQEDRAKIFEWSNQMIS
ncbi:MAG: steroid C27-monooxygenase, partial [Actinomycetes bacterium]